MLIAVYQDFKKKNKSVFWNLIFLGFLPELLICLTKLNQWLIMSFIWSSEMDFLNSCPPEFHGKGIWQVHRIIQAGKDLTRSLFQSLPQSKFSYEARARLTAFPVGCSKPPRLEITQQLGSLSQCLTVLIVAEVLLTSSMNPYCLSLHCLSSSNPALLWNLTVFYIILSDLVNPCQC